MYFLVLTPLYGIVLFIMLYIIAAMQYPGGSQIDADAKGFSWINNYWCNLLNENAMNGQHNTARPVALAGMVMLCFSLSIFWYIFPKHIRLKKYSTLFFQLSGILCMATATFMFTSLHDIIINVASLLGLIAVAGTFIGLYKNGWYRLLYFGLFNLLLVVLNNYIYYTKELIIYLPVIQKISFFLFLLWISLINVRLYQRLRIIPSSDLR